MDVSHREKEKEKCEKKRIKEPEMTFLTVRGFVIIIIADDVSTKGKHSPRSMIFGLTRKKERKKWVY